MANWTTGQLTAVGDRETRVRGNCRYMVYVHSKLMIIDDEFLIIGSANLNERSLAGDRDAEIGVYLRPGEGQLANCKKAITDLRERAWKDIFGALPSNWQTPHEKACVTEIRDTTTMAYVNMRLRAPSTCRVMYFPFYVDDSSFYVQGISLKSEDSFIPDAPVDSPGKLSAKEWMWASPLGLTSVGQETDLGE